APRAGPGGALRGDLGRPGPPPFPPAPAVGGQMVQGAPQVSLGIGLDAAPVPQQPLQGGLQQVLAISAAARQCDRNAHQAGAAFTEQPLQALIVYMPAHAITSARHLARTTESTPGLPRPRFCTPRPGRPGPRAGRPPRAPARRGGGKAGERSPHDPAPADQPSRPPTAWPVSGWLESAPGGDVGRVYVCAAVADHVMVVVLVQPGRRGRATRRPSTVRPFGRRGDPRRAVALLLSMLVTAE